MSRQCVVRRRSFLAAAGAGLGTALLPTGTGTARVSRGPTTNQCVPSSPANQRPSSHTQNQQMLRQRVTVEMDWEHDRLLYTYEFEIPDQLTELSIELPRLQYEHLAVTEMSQLSARDSNSQEIPVFDWTGESDPQLSVENRINADGFDAYFNGYLTDNEAFGFVPLWTLNWETGGTDPEVIIGPVSFDGDGYANRDFVFAGPHESASRTVDGTELTILLPESTIIDVDTTKMLDLMAVGEGSLGSVRLEFDRKGFIVLPGDEIESFRGQAIGGSWLISDSYWNEYGISNLPTHEFAHTVFGVFGLRDMYWLTEASAEYYGYLISLNAGRGTIGHFHDTVRVQEQFADAVLTNAERMRQTTADYSKGAHVLAALDAEIRQRSDHERMLLDIYRNDYYDLETYGEFESAVVEAAGDKEMIAWLDSYVRGSDLPDIPADRQYFTLPGQSPEAIPREIPRSSPTPTQDSTATPPSTATSTATTGETAVTQATDGGTAQTESKQRETSGTNDAGGPGFSLTSALAGLGGVGYLLARRFGGDNDQTT